MKTDKKMKLESSSLEVMGYFKKYLEKSVARGDCAQFLNFEEHHCKDDYVLFAILDYSAFKAKIIFKPHYLFSSNFIDVKFILDIDYEYSIYDIFNLFDIKDFTQYYYSNLFSKSEVEKALSRILQMIDRYAPDIERAAQGENAVLLKSNFEADWNAASGNTQEWEDDIHDPYFWDLVHPFFTCASDAVDSEKLLNKLRRLNKKGKLDTLYEKRLLEYMEKGGKTVNTNEVERFDFEKKFRKTKRKVNFFIFAFTAIAAAIMIWAVKAILFSGAYVPQQYIYIGAVLLPVPIYLFGGWLGVSVILGGALINLFGTKVLIRLSGNDERTVKKYEHEQNKNDLGKKSNAKKISLNVVFICLAVFYMIVLSYTNIGFYDDRVKFADEYSMSMCTVTYNDLIIYKIQGYYAGDTDEYYEYENAYALADSDGYFYNLEEIDAGGTVQKYIDSIIQNYNKEAVEIQSIEDIEE